jgi:hypothetical protein
VLLLADSSILKRFHNLKMIKVQAANVCSSEKTVNIRTLEHFVFIKLDYKLLG